MRLVTRCAVSSTCTLPHAAGIGPSPVVLRADAGSGMGVMQLDVTLAPLSSDTPATPVKFTVSA